ELNETEKVLRIELPADQQAPAPLNPGEEAFDQPAPGISAELAPVLGERLHSIGAMRGDHFDALAAQFMVERMAVVCTSANEVYGLCFDHVEVEAELHQASFVCGMGADRKRQAMAIHNRH